MRCDRPSFLTRARVHVASSYKRHQMNVIPPTTPPPNLHQTSKADALASSYESAERTAKATM